MKVKNDLLEDVSFQATANCGGSFFYPPDMLILHYSASDSFCGTVNWLCNPNAQVSAHLVVGRKGEITQLVAFNKKAWHAGTSEWTIDSGEKRTDLNRFSLGIEIANVGCLKEENGKFFDYTKENEYKGDDVIHATQRNQQAPLYWRTFSAKQLETVKEICKALLAAYPIQYILGHEEIAPARKIDPGPAFPLETLRAELLPAKAAEYAEVTAARLNIRKVPGGDLVSNPLENGKVVKILEKEGDWVKVETTITGWVFGRYLKTKKK